ncbi:ABC transporter ATP-binding protein [Micromonospora olivasterospora]|uniref:Amino acid/amide ABC transporter ATP-binding protein 2, HAAT family (TC 3.A.1.4.-) n=1 Tax=Micromonospora olivasterospora TaxID=1880 RepID=A0A562I3E4_MICOL|nr:ABC transporter ATP-binding protein [Micromonospora olivasterospora]TWH65326.1 amino acid/amide ABC transporter ATP-binding protein 2, HAAT family (TC 3.A.1.4.-) [Micromonospora olivasterospora]
MSQSPIDTTSAPENDAALLVSDLSVGYGQTDVLRGVSLRVDAGSVTALVGPNGAGKTTLLRAVSGLLPVKEGSVQFFGDDVTRLEPFRRAQQGLCHIPEGRAVYRSLTVRENLQLQASPDRETEAIERAVAAFPILGDRLGQQAGTMSGGEQQMLAMAAAYVRDVRLIVVDEPSLGLSPVMVDKIYEFLGAMATGGTALLLIDQFVDRAMAMADAAYVMRRGEIVFDGEPATLMAGDVFDHYVGG